MLIATEDHPAWNATDQVWEGLEQFDAGDRVLTAGGNALVNSGVVDHPWIGGNAVTALGQSQSTLLEHGQEIVFSVRDAVYKRLFGG